MNKGLVVMWLGSLGLSFCAGYFMSQTTNVRNSNELTSQESKSEQTGSGKSEIKRTTFTGIDSEKSSLTSSHSDSSHDNDTTQSTTQVNVLAQLESLLSGDMTITPDLMALGESYLLLEDLPEAAVLEMLQELTLSPNGMRNRQVVDLLLTKLARTNPQEALKFANQNIKSPMGKITAIQSVVATWSKAAPEEALEWLRDNKTGLSGNALNGVYMVAFGQLAKLDVHLALDQLSMLEDSPMTMMMAINGISANAESTEQFSLLMDKARDFPHQRAYSSIMTQWAFKDTQGAIEWVNQIENIEDKKRYKLALLSSWQYFESDKASDWFINSAENRDEAVATILTTWALTDPKRALNWLQNTPNIDFQTHLSTLLGSSLYQHPNLVDDNLYLLEDLDDRQTFALRIYSTYKRQNPESASEYLRQSDYKDYINERLDESGNVQHPIKKGALGED